MPITTKVVSSNPVHARCTRYIICDKVCQRLATGTPLFSTNKPDRRDVAEISLKVVLNSMNQQTNWMKYVCIHLWHNNYRKIYKLECGEDGTWKGDNCVPITCQSPDIVFKGLYRCSDVYNAGSTCTMMCPDNSVGLYVMFDLNIAINEYCYESVV